MVAALRPHFGYHLARINFMAAFVLALIRVRTVNLSQIAVGLNGGMSQSSNYRRIQRFFRGFELSQEGLARLVLALVGVGESPDGKGWVISLDRTEWELGQVSINVMVAGLVYRGICLPLVWVALDKDGNSNTQERQDLLKRLLKLLPPAQIRCLVADREFIGKVWFRWLRRRKVVLCIRIKADARYTSGKRGQVRHLFAHLKVGEYQELSKTYSIYGSRVCLVGMRLHTQWLILATHAPVGHALRLYKLRWAIETLFGCLKSRGFNLEDTHLTLPLRLEKLVALLTLALLWAFLLGEYLCDHKPLKPKKHGRNPKSIFRVGLDFLRQVLLHPAQNLYKLPLCFQVLSCT